MAISLSVLHPVYAKASDIEVVEIKSVNAKSPTLYDQNGIEKGRISRDDLSSKLPLPLYVPVDELKQKILIPIRIDGETVYVSQRDLIVKRAMCNTPPHSGGNTKKTLGSSALGGNCK